ncbi:MAG: dCTP deaminase [Actinomycetota bacterium]|jgi:deoxycytidine triphosphate deaminase|nr:dCTP deaminase [Actinomycetota bacterium]
MLLSDRDLKAALASGRMGLAPYDEAMVQPSSVDVRLDRYFRVFANHRYTHIDPAVAQDDLTELLEPDGEEPFILHPGEFVLGSTLEVITLGHDLAARLEGKALAVDTEVPTPWGWTTMEHLEVGDEVFDENGNPTAVVAATDVMTDRPCYEVLLSDGSRFVADAAHLWVTRTKGERVRGLSGSARTTEQLAATLRTGREWNHEIEMSGGHACLLPDLVRHERVALSVGAAVGGPVRGGLHAADAPVGAVTVALPASSRAVVAVRPISTVPVRCIQVAASSGMFLVGRTFVPTHNSSLGRLGLLTHSTAGFIDPGFSGHVTLELSNVANLPIKLYPGMKIGQICVLPLTSPAEHPYGSSIYGSRYQDQRGPTPSRSHLRFSRTPTQP